MNFLAKRIVMKRLDKEDKKFIAPHFGAGVVTPGDLRKIADLCEKFPESKIKLGAEIIIGGIREETRNKEFRSMLCLPTFSVAGFRIRPVKICSGGFICDNNLQDSFSLGLKLDEKFSGRTLPFKMIISISGCARCCSEPMVRDIGIMACRQGYAVFVGGAAGARPRIGVRLIDNLSQGEVIDTVEGIVGLYEKMGRTPERLGMFIERLGFERFRKECQH